MDKRKAKDKADERIRDKYSAYPNEFLVYDKKLKKYIPISEVKKENN